MGSLTFVCTDECLSVCPSARHFFVEWTTSTFLIRLTWNFTHVLILTCKWVTIFSCLYLKSVKSYLPFNDLGISLQDCCITYKPCATNFSPFLKWSSWNFTYAPIMMCRWHIFHAYKFSQSRATSNEWMNLPSVTWLFWGLIYPKALKKDISQNFTSDKNFNNI